ALAELPPIHGLLRQLVDQACALTGARGGALGVLEPDNMGLADSIVIDREHEIDSLEARRIVQELALSPRSHPLGPSEIGFALHINRYPIGGVYLFDKAGDAAFTEEDDELLELFSSQAAVAIAHAQQLEQAEQGKRRLSSLYDQLAKT